MIGRLLWYVAPLPFCKRLDASHQPPIHLAVCESREVDPALGLYDLQSAAGPTKFAEFLLSISDQISVVQDCLRSRKSVREICWRLDHNHLDKEGQNPHISEPLSSVRSLTTWLQDVSNSRSPEVKYDPSSSKTILDV